MDSPPNLETVYQAVFSLYNNTNPTEPGKASLWLGELQKSIFAWQIADEMLHQRRNIESCYFAAQTMRTKIQLSFHELPQEAHTSLRDSLMEHISQINEHTNSAIVTQLCLALADLALQMSSWQKPVVDLINRFGGNAANLWPLLEIMTVLPEEVNSRSLRLGDNHREHIVHELNASADTVTEFLKMCLKNSGDNLQIQVTILRCFTSWITIHAIPLKSVPSSEVFMYALEVLSNQSVSQLHETATDCICVILQALGEDSNINRDSDNEISVQLQQLQLCLFTSVMNLEQPYHLSVAYEDMEKSINYCRIFTELAETFLDIMVTGTEGSEDGKQHYAIQILDLVLKCVGHHDYEVAQITFNLWYRLSEHLYQKNSDDLNAVFRPRIERLISALCRHCQMEPDHLGLVEEGGGGEEFADFRNRVSDLIKDVVFVVGSSHCFRQMFSSLTGGPGPQGQPVHTPTWDSTEAALFIMQAVAKNILPEENDVVPRVVQDILNLPENTHIAVRYTSILLLGELCEWLDRHPQLLERVLNFLLYCLNQRSLGSAASGALLSICTACPLHMTTHFSGLLQIARSLDNFAISNDAAIGLLKGVSIILAKLPHEEIIPAITELCRFQASSLWALLANRRQIERGTKTDPVIWLDRLAAIFKHTNPQIDDPNKPHPCESVLTEMCWPVLSNVCETYQQDVRVMERCCRCIRFAVRCVGKHSTQLLEPIVTQIVRLYTVHKHSCFLYLGSILVDEYATNSECVLLNMLQAFIGPTFEILEQEDGLKNHPDTVDDLFRLCARFLQRAPISLLCSLAIGSIVDCAIMACSLDHRDANSSVMKFFYDLLHSGRSYKDRSDYTIRRQLVQNILKEKGQTLVIKLLHASVFELSSYMLSDVADVIIELTRNADLMSKWLEEAIKTMPSQNAGGALTATPEQLLEFHCIITRSETPKAVTNALRNFARLYR
ncbi:PREDICTED: transportin-3 isoform X1 [Trachymyrmex septentrionalis]|uniref:transportin-3 isoform X1 n=2 Tax=Trachymyrmex septentrionalis TaxID=34720 RepID=UPI00084F8096|nr:PREDICTED: transportin-3 isoform X1 [Trachymyrmex septentrionalis]